MDLSALKREAEAYNKQLETLQKEKLRAEANLTAHRESLNRLFTEYKEVTGIEMNEENMEEIKEKRIKQFKNDLEAGQEILDRIKNGDIDEVETEDEFESIGVEDNNIDEESDDEFDDI